MTRQGFNGDIVHFCRRLTCRPGGDSLFPDEWADNAQVNGSAARITTMNVNYTIGDARDRLEPVSKLAIGP